MNMASAASVCLPIIPSMIRTDFLTIPTTQHKYCSKYNGSTLTCKASSSASYSSMSDLDLYELLGIDSTSDQSQVKMAYRSLQKRCHPDIAGPDGHDMAIILNDAYAILSDPNARLAYDKVCVLSLVAFASLKVKCFVLVDNRASQSITHVSYI